MIGIVFVLSASCFIISSLEDIHENKGGGYETKKKKRN